MRYVADCVDRQTPAAALGSPRTRTLEEGAGYKLLLQRTCTSLFPEACGERAGESMGSVNMRYE
jgi:hypothetical protein